jgi:ribosome maturation factor RimP
MSKTKKEDYEQRAEQLVAPLVTANGCSIYDVEYVKEAGTYYLRVFIDKPDGVSIDDCETISRLFNEILDKEDFIEDAYIMEVSSPGLGRQLKKDRHFANSIGEEVEIKLFKAFNGSKIYVGILEEFSKENLTITNESGEVIIPRDNISNVRLTFDF